VPWFVLDGSSISRSHLRGGDNGSSLATSSPPPFPAVSFVSSRSLPSVLLASIQPLAFFSSGTAYFSHGPLFFSHQHIPRKPRFLGGSLSLLPASRRPQFRAFSPRLCYFSFSQMGYFHLKVFGPPYMVTSPVWPDDLLRTTLRCLRGFLPTSF